MTPSRGLWPARRSRRHVSQLVRGELGAREATVAVEVEGVELGGVERGGDRANPAKEDGAHEEAFPVDTMISVWLMMTLLADP